MYVFQLHVDMKEMLFLDKLVFTRDLFSVFMFPPWPHYMYLTSFPGVGFYCHLPGDDNVMYSGISTSAPVWFYLLLCQCALILK